VNCEVFDRAGEEEYVDTQAYDISSGWDRPTEM
jgi:hypothetical protein